MKILFIFVVANLFLQKSPADTAIEQIQQRYEKTTDMKADFNQVLYKKNVDMTFKRSGTVFFKKPGFMRWDYKQPEKIFYISDSTYLYQYKPEDRIVYKTKIKGSSVSLPFKFLFGMGKLKKEFKLIKFEKKSGNLFFVFAPKKEQTVFKKVKIEADAKTFEIKAVTIIDPIENENRIEFKNLSYQSLPEKGFKMNIPKGVRVKDFSEVNH